ncbi:MAG: AAA family ATPase [Mesorhizobium sp.]|nr:MAG: AAA family ATPase [Mesorhizobium sp.]
MDRLDDPYRGGDYDGRQAKPAGLHILSYAEMEAMPEPDWLVEGLIQKRSTALMFGKSNSFKSFLAIDIGLSVDTGRDWHGNAVSDGGVLFVATEGANGVGRLRIPAWYQHHNVSEEDRRAFLYPQEICLDAADDVTALIAAMNIRGAFALVVLDIFGGSMKGSEIEDKTARAWVHGIQRILRETGASVLTVAHTGWQDDTRARMHTHFWGSFDSRLRMEGDKDALTGTLTVERHKDADSSGSWGFRMTPTGNSLVPMLDAAVKASKGRNLTVRQRIAMQALDEAVQEHGTRKTGPDWPPCNIVLVDQWREACDRHGVSGSDKADSRLKAFNRSRDNLIDRGVIRIYDGYVWRCFDD